jgi:hypothetical protein
MERLGLLALLRGTWFRCHLSYLPYVVTAAGEGIRSSDCAHRQLPWAALLAAHSHAELCYRRVPRLVLMIADFRSANCLPRFNVPALKCQVAYFKVDAWEKMFVRGERQELFALNGSTSGEKLNIGQRH